MQARWIHAPMTNGTRTVAQVTLRSIWSSQLRSGRKEKATAMSYHSSRDRLRAWNENDKVQKGEAKGERNQIEEENVRAIEMRVTTSRLTLTA
jgi:heme-degrading monooxygenase HmoA